MCLTSSAIGQRIGGNPLVDLEQLKDFQAKRASSSDPDSKNGNADARPIEPGGTLTLADLRGPGLIAHMWCTMAHRSAFSSHEMTLRIYWDGETHPSVEAPLGDFFGIGKPVNSIPIRVSADGGGRNCYWPMPFRKSARVTVSNDSRRRCDTFYYYVD